MNKNENKNRSGHIPACTATVLCCLLLVISPLLGCTTLFAETFETLVRAQLKALNEPVIASQIGGLITHLKLQNGESFKKGDLLIQMNCSPQQKQLNLAKVILDKKEKIAKINNRLNQLGSMSELEIAMSSAEVEEATATLAYHKAIVRQCSIYAPFSGRVGERFVHRYQYVNKGEPIMQINDTQAFRIEMLIPSLWLRWIKRGYAFKVLIDETGNAYNAQIEQIASKVDPVSHTVKVYGTLLKQASELLPGMSGQVWISPPVVLGSDSTPTSANKKKPITANE